MQEWEWKRWWHRGGNICTRAASLPDFSSQCCAGVGAGIQATTPTWNTKSNWIDQGRPVKRVLRCVHDEVRQPGDGLPVLGVVQHLLHWGKQAVGLQAVPVLQQANPVPHCLGHIGVLRATHATLDKILRCPPGPHWWECQRWESCDRLSPEHFLHHREWWTLAPWNYNLNLENLCEWIYPYMLLQKTTTSTNLWMSKQVLLWQPRRHKDIGRRIWHINLPLLRCGQHLIILFNYFWMRQSAHLPNNLLLEQRENFEQQLPLLFRHHWRLERFSERIGTSTNNWHWRLCKFIGIKIHIQTITHLDNWSKGHKYDSMFSTLQIIVNSNQ